jgi:hypothetical protein
MWKEVAVDYNCNITPAFIWRERKSTTNFSQESGGGGGRKSRFEPLISRVRSRCFVQSYEFHVEIRKLVMKPLPEEGEHRHQEK